MKLSGIIMSGLVFSLVIVISSGVLYGFLGNDNGINQFNYADQLSGQMSEIETELQSSSGSSISFTNTLMLIPTVAISAIKMMFSSVLIVVNMIFQTLSSIGIPWSVTAIIMTIVLAGGIFALVSALSGRGEV